ncbi:MAG: helix-turn-helix transcriptional regulator [Eubacteriales bacterium]|jgi:transcriptional regulator with XRE-family HTH domain
MAIGERIRFIRNLRGMTQKYLGIMAGLPEKTADIRMAQYEAGTRTPKEDLTQSLANALGVSPLALNTPDIDSYLGLMHTLFTLEDRYGLTIETREGEVLFHIDPRKGQDAAQINQMVCAWAPVMEKYRSGEISKEEYDDWRYNYPRDDSSQIWARVPSAGLMDSIVEGMKK